MMFVGVVAAGLVMQCSGQALDSVRPILVTSVIAEHSDWDEYCSDHNAACDGNGWPTECVSPSEYAYVLSNTLGFRADGATDMIVAVSLPDCPDALTEEEISVDQFLRMEVAFDFIGGPLEIHAASTNARCQEFQMWGCAGACVAATPTRWTLSSNGSLLLSGDSLDTSVTVPSGTYVLDYQYYQTLHAEQIGPGDMCDRGFAWLVIEVTASDIQQHLADMNCDSVISVGDIQGFVLALTDRDTYCTVYPDCNADLADVNLDQTVSVGDIQPFVARLLR